MQAVSTYINSTNKTIYEKYGVELAESSLTALMTPPPLKSYISNSSATENGDRVVIDADAIPKVDKRELQLTFSLEAPTLAQYIMRYRAFVEELKHGAVDLMIHITEGDTYIHETYHLIYLSCTEYSEYNGRLGKFVIRFNEPNPENRTVEHSNDIEL